MRIVGQGIEKQIAKTMPREMRAEAASWREYQPVSIDAARLGFLTKVGLHANIRIKQPQHTAWDGVEKPHPDIEEFWRDLVAIVEAAKDEALIGEATLGPRGCALVDRAQPVIRLIGVRQMDDFLVVIRLLIHRQSVRIGNHVIDEVGAQRARIADEVHLDRRGPLRDDLTTRKLRVAFKVDENIDFVGVDACRRGAVVEVR